MTASFSSEIIRNAHEMLNAEVTDAVDERKKELQRRMEDRQNGNAKRNPFDDI